MLSFAKDCNFGMEDAVSQNLHTITRAHGFDTCGSNIKRTSWNWQFEQWEPKRKSK